MKKIFRNFSCPRCGNNQIASKGPQWSCRNCGRSWMKRRTRRIGILKVPVRCDCGCNKTFPREPRLIRKTHNFKDRKHFGIWKRKNFRGKGNPNFKVGLTTPRTRQKMAAYQRLWKNKSSGTD